MEKCTSKILNLDRNNNINSELSNKLTINESDSEDTKSSYK